MHFINFKNRFLVFVLNERFSDTCEYIFLNNCNTFLFQAWFVTSWWTYEHVGYQSHNMAGKLPSKLAKDASRCLPRSSLPWYSSYWYSAFTLPKNWSLQVKGLNLFYFCFIIHVSLCRGNYEQFEKTKTEKLKNQQREYEAQMQHRAHVQEFIDRFRYNANRAASVQSKIKMLEKL